MRSIWVHEIEGFEECLNYKVYENGDIESFQKKKPRFLKPYLDTKGYPLVDLRPKRAVKVHRLVAKAFLDNPQNKPQVNHKNGKKVDNRACNLEWVTNSENQIHANKLGLRKSPKKEGNYQYNKEHENCKKVRQLSLDGEEVAVHLSLAMAGRSLGKGYTTISKVCRGIGETAYGYRWEFVDEDV